VGRIQKVIAWASTRSGRAELAAFVGALGALYDALHKAGVL